MRSSQPYLLGVDPSHNNLSRWETTRGSIQRRQRYERVGRDRVRGGHGGDWSTEVAQYTIAPPVVTSVSPSSGVSGTLVTFGANFTNTSLVAFGRTRQLPSIAGSAS
jgi:hypothetical protein